MTDRGKDMVTRSIYIALGLLAARSIFRKKPKRISSHGCAPQESKQDQFVRAAFRRTFAGRVSSCVHVFVVPTDRDRRQLCFDL